MALTTDIRKSVTETTPLMAVVGATDLAVEKVREFEPAKLQASVQQVPANAVAAALEVAGKAETQYEALAERGKELVERIRTEKATQELLSQGKATLSRTKAAVTTTRRGLDETVAAARGTVTTATKQIRGTVVESKDLAEAGAKATKASAQRTTTTARKRAAATRSATKGATTSARKTAEQAVKAAETAAEQIGD